ncbi:hypothetical protein Tco_0013257 [Tanacetum coccineum]
MRTIVVRVLTRNQSWNVGNVARLVTSRGIAVVVIRTTQKPGGSGKRSIYVQLMQLLGERFWCYNSMNGNERCWFKTFEPVEDGFCTFYGVRTLCSLTWIRKRRH